MFPLSPGHRCILPSIGRHYNSKFYLSTALLYHRCFEMYADDPAFSDCQRHQVLGGLASMWPVRTSPISWCNSKTGHTILWCEATLIENSDHSDQLLHSPDSARPLCAYWYLLRMLMEATVIVTLVMLKLKYFKKCVISLQLDPIYHIPIYRHMSISPRGVQALAC